MARGCSLVLLAGGESKRMGRDKAALPAGDHTLLERIIDRLAPGVDEVILASGDRTCQLVGIRVVSDRFAHAGPLAGIHAGLTAASFEHAWVVACDYPDAAPAVGERLREAVDGVDAAVPRVFGLAHGTCAVYSVRLARVIEDLIASGHHRVRDLLDRSKVRYVEESDLRQIDPELRAFRNLNTWGEYQEWLMSQSAPR